MINDLGIQVFETAPDADEILLSEEDSTDDIAAAEAAVGLAIIISVYRSRRSVIPEEADMLKG